MFIIEFLENFILFIYSCLIKYLIHQSIMLSDETFPSDLISDDEEVYQDKNIKLPNSLSVTSSEDLNSSTEIEQSFVNSMETDRLIKSTDFQSTTGSDTEKEISSFDSSNNREINILPPPPKAPIKKKKSFSCHNLNNMKKNIGPNYDHVESKVKKLIENLAEDRRKTLLRHKSMPVCVPQTPVIEESKPDMEKDMNDLKRELRRKSIKIYELEEKCELKDNQIYDLERERSRMKMVFDKLRVEMQELKEIEKQYKKIKSQYSPFKNQRNAIIQTDDSGIDSEYSKVNILRESVVITQHHNEQNHVLLNPCIRQLAFENLSQTHISDTNNTSSDHLIPETEINFDQIEIDESSTTVKDELKNFKSKNLNKKKKKLKFFSFVPCVSFK